MANPLFGMSDAAALLQFLQAQQAVAQFHAQAQAAAQQRAAIQQQQQSTPPERKRVTSAYIFFSIHPSPTIFEFFLRERTKHFSPSSSYSLGFAPVLRGPVVPVHLSILRDLPKGRALLEAAVPHPTVPCRQTDVPVSSLRFHVDVFEEQREESHGLSARFSYENANRTRKWGVHPRLYEPALALSHATQDPNNIPIDVTVAALILEYPVPNIERQILFVVVDVRCRADRRRVRPPAHSSLLFEEVANRCFDVSFIAEFGTSSSVDGASTARDACSSTTAGPAGRRSEVPKLESADSLDNGVSSSGSAEDVRNKLMGGRTLSNLVLSMRPQTSRPGESVQPRYLKTIPACTVLGEEQVKDTVFDTVPTALTSEVVE
ncbi:hypothetical protein NECAME_15506, partial [Necator americanus]